MTDQDRDWPTFWRSLTPEQACVTCGGLREWSAMPNGGKGRE